MGPADGFIGREVELAWLQAQLAAGHRLVSVIGSGGVGKTRLLRELLTQGAGDAVFVDLSTTTSEEATLASVASALGLAPSAGGSAAGIARSLADRGPLLLALDNLEQIVDAARDAVSLWLAEAPTCAIIITSRESLGHPAEQVLALEPLPVPAEDDLDVSRSDAARLFLERARATWSEIAVTPATAARVSAIVRGLDGLPLAIELAAAHVDVLGLDGLVARLPRHLDAVASLDPSTPSRHASLRGAVAWSWALLGEHEREVLVQASVFVGSFDADAAEAVLGTGAIRVLSALRRKSLLRIVSTPDAPGPPRLALLAPVRDFAREQLDRLSPEAREAIHRRHGLTFADSGLRRARRVAQTGDLAELTTLNADRENLVAALDGGHADDRGLELALALEPALEARGPLSLGLRVFERALTLASEPSSLRAQVRRARGRFQLLSGRTDEALTCLSLAVDEARASGDRVALAEALRDLGLAHHQKRDAVAARTAYDEALTLARAQDDARAVGRLLGNLGALEHDQRDLDSALERYREALAVLRELHDVRLEGLFLANLALLEQEAGATEEARDHFDAAIASLRLAGDRRLEAIAQSNLGALASEQARDAVALELHGAAVAVLRTVGDDRSLALGLVRQAIALAGLLRVAEARDRFDDAAHVAARVGDPMVLETLELARAFLDHALALRARSEGRGEAAEEHLARVRRRIAMARTCSLGAGRLVDASDDVRLTLRMLDRLVPPSGPSVVPRPGALSLAADARWLIPPNGAQVDLSRRRTLRGIVFALAKAQATGERLDLEGLRVAGWGDERMSVEAATNRVHVALAALRQLGLRDHLHHDSGRYWLSPPVVFASPD